MKLNTHHACTLHAIFKKCWQTSSYKHFSGREKISSRNWFFYLLFSLQKMTWAWVAVLQHRTFKHHRLNLRTASTHRPPILWHRTCWVKLTRRKTVILGQFITTTTTPITTRDFRTLTRNIKCLRRLQRTFIPTTKGSMDMEWSDKLNTSPDKLHGRLTKIFLVVRKLSWKKISLSF